MNYILKNHKQYNIKKNLEVNRIKLIIYKKKITTYKKIQIYINKKLLLIEEITKILKVKFKNQTIKIFYFKIKQNSFKNKIYNFKILILNKKMN